MGAEGVPDLFLIFRFSRLATRNCRAEGAERASGCARISVRAVFGNIKGGTETGLYEVNSSGSGEARIQLIRRQA